MKEMRRKDRAINKEESIAILNNAEYGVLSTVAKNGEPYGVPLSFCIIDNYIYIHCAIEGQKIDNIKHNKSVSFCVVGRTEILPDKFSTNYESVIIAGKAEEVFSIDKQRGLEGLLYKYSPDFIEQGEKYIHSLSDETRVFKITIDHLSGKARNTI